MQIAVIRGGTSRGVFFNAKDLPAANEEREAAVLRLFGSESGSIVDGLGGQNPVLRKAAIVAPRLPQSDSLPVLDLWFGQVDETLTTLATRDECGNISSGVPLFGALMGWCPQPSPGLQVIVNLMNTGAQIRVEWVEASSSGGRLVTWLVNPYRYGSARVLGLDQPVIAVETARLGRVECSIIQGLNTYVFVRSRDVGHPDPLVPDEFDPDLHDGLAEILEAISLQLPEAPTLKMSVVAAGSNSTRSLLARTVYPFERRSHPSIAVTGGAALVAAACHEGTIVHELLDARDDHEVRVEHPSGSIKLPFRSEGALPVEIGIERTCRLIVSGTAY
jgi:4-oxalomesaconate tautomerase